MSRPPDGESDGTSRTDPALDDPEPALRELISSGDQTMMLSVPIILQANGIEYFETRFRVGSTIVVREEDYDRARALINEAQETPLVVAGPRYATIIVVGLLTFAFLVFLVASFGDYW
jgi:hypothetical protein